MANGRQALYDALKTFTFSLSQGLAAQSQAPGKRGSQMGMAAALGAPLQMQDMETKRQQQEQESAQRQQQITELIRRGRVEDAVALLKINPRAAEAKLPDFTETAPFPGQSVAPPVQQGGTFEAPLPPIPVPLASGTINMPQTSQQQMGRDALAKVFGEQQAQSMFKQPPQQIPGRDIPLPPDVAAQRTAMAQATQQPPQQIPGRDIPFPPAVQAQRLAQRAPASGATGTNGKSTDVKDVAGAIVRGEQPPVLTGLYRDTLAVRGELARQGYDLATANRDWTAIQRHLATLNGAQQERLRQAISFTSDSMEIIDDLYKEWLTVGPASGFKILNRAALKSAAQLPGKPGEVAQNLEAQINDLVSELGTVYKGGNASTDESLRLAAENLKADWNKQTFERAMGQIRKNLTIRKNSILTSQPVGVSGGSPYNPLPPGTPTPSDPAGLGGGPLTAPKPVIKYDNKGNRIP